MARLIPFLLRYVKSLRFPWLVGITAALFAANVLIPDAIPLVDELILGLTAAALASLRNRDDEDDDQPEVLPRNAGNGAS